MNPSALKTARKKLKLSLDRLSEDVAISVSQLSRFENGQRVPRVPELERIARRLGVSVEYLLGVAPATEPAHPSEQAPAQGLSEQQAHVVRLVVQAFLGWSMADPVLQKRMKEEAYQAAVARVISQYVQSPKLHQAIARDGQAALAAIQTALEFQLHEVH